MKKERLVAFTDAILAIIMTILVLELDKPSQPTVKAFWDLRTNFFAYALSFFWLGSLWVGLNSIWEKVEQIDTPVIWWNILLLFLASLIPYATSLCSTYYNNAVIQVFYGIVVIAMTVCNYFLHKALDRPNSGNPALLKATAQYRKILLPDIVIKCIGLVLSLILYPPLMMYSVLIAAVYILTMKYRNDRKTVENEN